jgi:hypothetical protein
VKKFVETVGGGREEPKKIGHRVVDGKKLIISETKDKFKNGFIGMHKRAANDKSVDVKTNIPNNEIVLYKGQSKKTKATTLHHELIETFLMSKGLNYKEAHQVALRFESTKTTPQGAFKWYLNNKK